MVTTCLDSGYTLHHRPRNNGRRCAAVGVLINNQINVKSRVVCVNPEITSLVLMEVELFNNKSTFCYLSYADREIKEWFKTRYIL